MRQTREERQARAKLRLTRVLTRHGAAIARTIEQKISDAGPFNQRIDPHILNPVRNEMVQQGSLQRHHQHGVDWYCTPDVTEETRHARIEEQFAVYRLILDGGFNARMGQVLEIAVFRALQESSLLSPWWISPPHCRAHDAEAEERRTALDFQRSRAFWEQTLRLPSRSRSILGRGRGQKC